MDYNQFVGTRAVSEQHKIDQALLTSWMEQHVKDFAGPLTVESSKADSLIRPTSSLRPAAAT
jgi:hypothetical protein